MVNISRRIDVMKFFGTNFEMWKLKIEDLFIDRDLWNEIDENKLRPVADFSCTI